MRLGKGAIRDGGYNNPNLLSSTFEAFIGAYYLDNNSKVEPVRTLVKKLFDSVPEKIVVSRSNIDLKNQLQEWVQINISPEPPKYLTEKAGGLDHSPVFMAQVLVGNRVFGEGTGTSKKDAEKRAAEDALAKLKKQGLL
jgi:ribonuclease-3